MQTVQAALTALVSQVVTLVVAFGIINNNTAGAVASCVMAAINTGFVIAVSIENHGKAVAAATKASATTATNVTPLPTATPPKAA